LGVGVIERVPGGTQGPVGFEREEEEPSEELLRVRRGEITETEYLEICVEKAMAHIKGRVPLVRLETIRQTLLSKLDTDPLLLHAKARVFTYGRGRNA
jgi:hypothetical protein